MSRIIAFLASNRSGNGHTRAKYHLQRLADIFNIKTETFMVNSTELTLCYEGKLPANLSDKSVSFSLGTIYDDIGTIRTRDRFLDIKIDKEITVVSDYAGSIPLFYSTRGGISLSNIEPAVVLDTESRREDISDQNLYGFFRFSHFIWDETLWVHVYSMEPDSKFVFNIDGSKISKKYLSTVGASDRNIGASDSDIAKRLLDLNMQCVSESFVHTDMIRLPLSAGYDSRMIACALSSLHKKDRVDCFSYGDEGTIEVETAKRVCAKLNLPWRRVGVSNKFLDKEYITKIGMIFGSSLHFHGMYQIETTLQSGLPETNFDVLTSGFMTGVPAGQHISLLGLDGTKSLVSAMNSFSQSRLWSMEDLLGISPIFRKDFEEIAEERFRKAYNRFEGSHHHKSIMFDVWTRQRNFISYHPKTVEWMLPFVSPHMKISYANFFLSLSPRHLTDRRAVELMFERHYPEVASVISNSNGTRALSGIKENAILYGTRAMKKFGLGIIVPKTFQNARAELDLPAVLHAGIGSLWPISELSGESMSTFHKYLPDKVFRDSVHGMLSDRSVRHYLRMLVPQALAYGLHIIE